MFLLLSHSLTKDSPSRSMRFCQSVACSRCISYQLSAAHRAPALT